MAMFFNLCLMRRPLVEILNFTEHSLDSEGYVQAKYDNRFLLRMKWLSYMLSLNSRPSPKVKELSSLLLRSAMVERVDERDELLFKV